MTGKPAAANASRRLSQAQPYSYRADPAVPAFPDDKGLVVFDGVCVLCSGFVQFVILESLPITDRKGRPFTPPLVHQGKEQSRIKATT